MKRFILTICALLSAVPAIAQQPLVSGSTTGEVTFVVYDDTGAVVTGATVSSVIRRRGTGDDTAMTTPTVTEEGNGFYSLVVDEDTTITTGLVREAMFFRINMSSGEPVFVMAVLESAQYTLQDLVDAILDEALSGHNTAGTVGKAILDAIKAGVAYTVSSENDPTHNVEYTEE